MTTFFFIWQPQEVWRGDIVIIKNTPVVRSYLIYIAAYLLDIFIPWRHGYVLTFFQKKNSAYFAYLKKLREQNFDSLPFK